MAFQTEQADFQPLDNTPLSDAQSQIAANHPLGFDALDQSECANVCINDLVVDLTPVLTRLVGSDIQVRHELGAGIKAVWGDAGLLEQVIVNLAVSAREAMPDGGTLSITTETINDMLDAHRTPTGVRVTISDSGTGADAAGVLHSCDPDLTSKPVSASLMAADSIVQEHNGVITINSEIGHGTDICVELPFSVVRSSAL